MPADTDRYVLRPATVSILIISTGHGDVWAALPIAALVIPVIRQLIRPVAKKSVKRRNANTVLIAPAA